MKTVVSRIGYAIIMAFGIWLAYCIGKDIGYEIGIREEDAIHENECDYESEE